MSKERDDNAQRKEYRVDQLDKASEKLEKPADQVGNGSETLSHPLGVLTDGKGGAHDWKPYTIGKNGEHISIEKQPGVYPDVGNDFSYTRLGVDGGHVDSHETGKPNFYAFETSETNRDGTAEKNGEKQEKEAVAVSGLQPNSEVAINADSLTRLEDRGLVPAGTREAAKPTDGWQIDMGVTEPGYNDYEPEKPAPVETPPETGTAPTDNAFGLDAAPAVEPVVMEKGVPPLEAVAETGPADNAFGLDASPSSEPVAMEKGTPPLEAPPPAPEAPPSGSPSGNNGNGGTT